MTRTRKAMTHDEARARGLPGLFELRPVQLPLSDVRWRTAP